MKSLSLLQRVGLILLPLLLVGCFGPRKDNVRHFALQVPAGESAARRHPGTLLVGDLDVSRVHDRRAMLVRRSAVEVHYERERRWADRPHVMLSDAIAGHLGAAGLFATVVRSLGDRPPTWVLGGRVDAFEVVAGKKGWQVRLTMRLDLRRLHSDEGHDLFDLIPEFTDHCGFGCRSSVQLLLPGIRGDWLGSGRC